MTMTSFSRQLFQTGTALAEQWNAETEITDELTEIIRQAHGLARAEAAFECPTLDLDAAFWSLQVLAWGCCVFADRTEVNTTLPTFLTDREPKGDSPAEHWSADLGFRFLHSLIVRCRNIGPYDSLVQQLTALGNRWPLATVGIHTEVNSQKLELLLADNCLSNLLVDRVVQRHDEALAKHPLIEPHVAYAVGAQPNFKSWSMKRTRF